MFDVLQEALINFTKVHFSNHSQLILCAPKPSERYLKSQTQKNQSSSIKT